MMNFHFFTIFFQVSLPYKTKLMLNKTIVELLKDEPIHQRVKVRGWVRSFRSNRFIALNDGSTIKTLQCVVDFENFEESLLKKVSDRKSTRLNSSHVRISYAVF